MIVGTFRSIEVGQTYHGCTDRDRKLHKDQPYMVLREATKEEWFIENRDLKLTTRELEMINDPNAKFYEISLD